MDKQNNTDEKYYKNQNLKGHLKLVSSLQHKVPLYLGTLWCIEIC